MSILEKLFGFKGRIGRGTYWLYSIVLGVFGYIGELVVASFQKSQSSAVTLIGLVFSLILLLILIWAELALSVKRWHDRGKSAWWILITLVPVIGGLWEFIELALLPGTDGPNEYGVNSN